MGDVAGFKSELEKEILKYPGVRRVEFFGSIAESTFKQGKSDLDVAVHGRVSSRQKKEIAKLIKELNYKYRMGLERAPLVHPTPFYIRDRFLQFAFRESFNGHLHLAQYFEPERERLKREGPTYGDYWRGEDVRGKVIGLAPVAAVLFFLFS